jgi:hypothetical protein
MSHFFCRIMETKDFFSEQIPFPTIERRQGSIAPPLSISPQTGYHTLAGWRVRDFRQKTYSAEDGIDGTNSLFRQNSSCSAEQKTLGIPFLETIPRKRKMLGIPYHGTKIEAHSRNFVLWNKSKSKLLEFYSETFCGKNTLSILFAGTGNLSF